MSYYSAQEMKKLLSDYPQYQNTLYCKGFLFSTKKVEIGNTYPFYGNWNAKVFTVGNHSYYLYNHKDTYTYIYEDTSITFFMIGHAYNPFNMLIDENVILKELARLYKKGKKAFWDAESELTGVFCIGYVTEKEIIYSTDCTGMQLVYHGSINGNLYLTSHSKLVADLEGLKQTEYVRRITNSRFWRYWGTWLPGDLSPFDELKRMQPNCAGKFNLDNKTIKIIRYYPLHKIVETSTEEEYTKTIHELSRIMSNNMKCIAQKWTDKKVSISVTGGRDSLTTLACSKDVYDKYSYFSYISNYDESVDAYAARDILEHLGLKHELYEIPDNWEEYKNIDVYKKIMQCNAGCIGANNENDVKKRMYFASNPPCDIEVKSWVGEMGRSFYYGKYNKKKFPKYPTASYWRAMHKVYVHPWIIHHTTKVFKDYIKKYYSKKVFDCMSWLDIYFWEFVWSGGEGVFLTSEHRISYDITIPFNNRKYIELMLTVPLEKRKADAIPNDIISYMEPRIDETGISIKDVSHTNMRALIVRTYLEIFSRIHI